MSRFLGHRPRAGRRRTAVASLLPAGRGRRRAVAAPGRLVSGRRLAPGPGCALRVCACYGVCARRSAVSPERHNRWTGRALPGRREVLPGRGHGSRYHWTGLASPVRRGRIQVVWTRFRAVAAGVSRDAVNPPELTVSNARPASAMPRARAFSSRVGRATPLRPAPPRDGPAPPAPPASTLALTAT